MFQNILTPERELPPDCGFSVYGPGHLTMLGIIGLVLICLWLFLRHRPRWYAGGLYRIFSVCLILLELFKDLTLGLMGTFSMGYLPLHLCSIAMFICLRYAFHPDSPFAGQLLYSVCLPGALCGLLFPNWTHFPLLHFQSMTSFLFHGILVWLSALPVMRKEIRPGISRVPGCLGFLIALAVPVYGLNRLLGTNYMFLNHASAGSPLELLTALPGTVGYLTGYVLLAAAVIFFMNLPFSLWRFFRRKCP
ncbi:MAG: TIGR02206 family membrane protein [Oscillospiraceae bacterium]|nr:TIGR02206 family membrane protein [Oscillospiraceae bacterium]